MGAEGAHRHDSLRLGTEDHLLRLAEPARDGAEDLAAARTVVRTLVALNPAAARPDLVAEARHILGDQLGILPTAGRAYRDRRPA